MLRATNVRIYPTLEQAAFLNRQFGAVRFVWNKALAIKTHWYKVRGQNLSPRKHLKPLLAVARKSRRYGWLGEADSIALQQAIINLDIAFQISSIPNCKRDSPGSSQNMAGRVAITARLSLPVITGSRYPTVS